MFDFIQREDPVDAIAGLYFALRRISHRSTDPNVPLTATATAPITREEEIGQKILNEISDKENSSIEALTETQANKYKENLLDLADGISEQQARQILKEWERQPELPQARNELQRLSLKNKTNSLTLYEKLSLLISLVGALSLVFIFVQTMQATANMELSTASMKASLYATMNTQTLEMDKIFLEHPDLRPYFYEKRPPSQIPEKDTKDTYHRIMIVAEYQLDFFDLVMTQMDYIPPDKDSAEDKANWYAYFKDSFANSPALCQKIDLNRPWYMERLVNLSKEPCQNHAKQLVSPPN